jgi:16S rRNA processing protein RimM
MPLPENAWIAVARLLRPQGRRGELLSDLLTDLPGVLVAGREGVLASPGAARPAPDQAALVIEDVWSPTGKNAGRVVIKLSGCESISQAEALAGQELLLQTTDLPTLEPDTFFVADLLGCELYDGASLAGSIVGIEFPTSSDGRRLDDAAPLLAIQLRPPPDPLSAVKSSSALEDRPGLTLPLTPDTAPEPILVPFIRAWLDLVDLPARRIVMHLPFGLLDPPS